MELELKIQAGEIVATPDQQRLLEELMRRAFIERRADELEAFAQAIKQPIRIISEYVAAFDDVFVVDDIDYGEDPRVPVEQYDVVAWETSTQGTPQAVGIGMTWKTLSFVTGQAGFAISRYQRKAIPWNEAARKLRRCAEELARLRDRKTIDLLTAAATSLTGHVVNVTGGVLTRAAVEQVFQEAARIGYRITRVKVNSADVLAMRSGGNGWAADPFRVTDSQISRQLLRDGFLGEYGGAEWQASPAVPGRIAGVQDGLVFFLAEPEMLGYRRYLDRPYTRTVEDVEREETRYYVKETYGQIVVNPYAVFLIRILR